MLLIPSSSRQLEHLLPAPHSYAPPVGPPPSESFHPFTASLDASYHYPVPTSNSFSAANGLAMSQPGPAPLGDASMDAPFSASAPPTYQPSLFVSRTQRSQGITVARQLTVRRVSAYLSKLEGTCPLEFATYGTLQHLAHAEGSRCIDAPSTGDIAEFTKCFKFAKNKYCWHCGMMQDFQGNREKPAAHSSFTGGRCPWKGYPQAVLRVLFDREPVYTVFLKHFKLDRARMSTLEQYKDWCNTEDPERHPERFYNGLELFVWYCRNTFPTMQVN